MNGRILEVRETEEHERKREDRNLLASNVPDVTSFQASRNASISTHIARSDPCNRKRTVKKEYPVPE